MSDYAINGKSLSDFGINATRKSGNSVALSGAWDLPKRKGNILHDWKEADSVEAFVSANDLSYEGRSFILTGVMIPENNQTIEQLINSLQAYLDSESNKEIILSSQWGTWNVQMYDEIKITRKGNIAAEIEMAFFEPEPDITGILPVSDGSGEDIDGYSWDEFGLYISSVSGVSSIPARKAIDITNSYLDNNNTYGGRSSRRITISGIIIADNYSELVNKIHSLYALFTSPGLRIFKYKGVPYKCFAKDGFTIGNLNVSTKAIASWSIILTTADNE